jgi:glutaredoxin 2
LNVDIEYIGYDNESRKKIADMAGKFQVPVLEHNGEYLFESGDIIEYLKTVK